MTSKKTYIKYMKEDKNFLIILLSSALILLFSYFYIKQSFINDYMQVACTMEAKICPDGSAVGRSGPKCEFDLCPTP